MLPVKLSNLDPDVEIASQKLAKQVIKRRLSEASQRFVKLNANDDDQINYIMDLINNAYDIKPKTILSDDDLVDYYTTVVGSKNHKSYMMAMVHYLKSKHIGETNNENQHELVNKLFDHGILIMEHPIRKAQIKTFYDYAIRVYYDIYG